MPSFIDLTGERFGRLTVLSKAQTITYKNHRGRTITWDCQCDCGSRLRVPGCSLRTGNTQSCGCLHKDIMTIHGESTRQRRTPEYTAWVAMKARCSDPNHPSYQYYGGRGITVCQRWKDSYADFASDMGRRPPGHSIDRINNNGNYEPGNCRWATRREQSDNQGHHPTILMHDGKSRTITEWAAIAGLSRSALRTRLQRGWTLESALATPKISSQEQAARSAAIKRARKCSV
jgi:hypothetical protein